ncbi:MAG: nitroreductase/quinone reductase family protein, partial [Dehalococcoidia bacterium]
MTSDTEWLLIGARELNLITTGRKSGSPRAVELYFGYQNGYVYLLSGLSSSGTPTHWYRNLQAHSGVTIRIKSRDISAVAEPVP